MPIPDGAPGREGIRFTNSAARYGAFTKTLHWVVFLLLVNQFVAAASMLTMESWETRLGFAQSTLYEWHKSVGLVAFVVALIRYVWRRATPLPDWAPNMSPAEQQAIHWIERLLYLCMFVMPVSGFVFVMAGDYPIDFFAQGRLPNVIGVHPTLSLLAQWTHRITAWLLVATLVGHWGVGVRHQWMHGDRYLHRILPFTHQR